MLFTNGTIDQLLTKRLGQVEDIVLSIPREELNNSDEELITRYFSRLLITPVTLALPQQIGERETGINSMEYTYSISLTGDSEILSYKHITDKPWKHHPLEGNLSSSDIITSVPLGEGLPSSVADKIAEQWYGNIENELRPLNMYIQNNNFNQLIRNHIVSMLNTRRSNLSR